MSEHPLYFDYSASAPPDPEVLEAMLPYLGGKFGNPGSVHRFGGEAAAAVDRAREEIAAALGAPFRGTIFTGSATEANNLVLRGAVKAALRPIRRPDGPDHTPNIIVSNIEHESVLETARDLEKEGTEVRVLPVGPDGIVRPRDLEGLLDENSILVSVMYGNNVIGSIQPIVEVVNIVRGFREAHSSRQKTGSYPLIHTDAVQAFAYLPCDLGTLGVDAITVSAHKLGGPKGIGVLCLGNSGSPKESNPSGVSDLGFIILPATTGGSQEFGLRAGTENVAGIVGAAAAIKRAAAARGKEVRRLQALKERLWERLRARVPGIAPNPGPSASPGADPFGAGAGDPKRYLPHILNVRVPGMKAHELVLRLDAAGVAVSAGAACSARVTSSSYVFGALGFDAERREGNIRISMGVRTNAGEIDELAERFKMVIEKVA